MKSNYLTMQLRTSPHASRGISVEQIMRQVIYALIPTALAGIYFFGIGVLALLLTTTSICMITEYAITRFRKTVTTIGDGSAALTGLLLGLTLPPAFPLWMAVIGAIVSIAIGKSLFGGLGFNIFNPALVGRAFLQTTFPVAITTWTDVLGDDRFVHFPSSTLTLPFLRPALDAVSGATPLAAMKFDHQQTAISDLILGSVGGSSGETCALLILLGGIYLAFRNMLDWRIPVGIFAAVFVVSLCFHLAEEKYPSPDFMLFSGGLILGAVFMATDMVTSPITISGTWIYAFLIGFLIVIIRLLGGLPEGVMYAILLGNALTPLLSRFTRTRVYGTGAKTAFGAEKKKG